MKQETTGPATSSKSAENLWGHLLVSLCACILTISIAGSLVYLGWRIYDRHEMKSSVRRFVYSLENRTPEEIAEYASELRFKPKLVRYFVPEVIAAIRGDGPERQRRAAIRLSEAFISHDRVQQALLALRSDPNESVASAAVEALGGVEPPEKAAELLGACLVDAQSAAAVDEACAALYRLGDVGRALIKQRLNDLAVPRRVWLVQYVAQTLGPHQQAWLRMLESDQAAEVRKAAGAALVASSRGSARPKGADAPSTTGEMGT